MTHDERAFRHLPQIFRVHPQGAAARLPAVALAKAEAVPKAYEAGKPMLLVLRRGQSQCQRSNRKRGISATLRHELS